jgi:glycosyltransferase involved in cell wall biosynthesis
VPCEFRYIPIERFKFHLRDFQLIWCILGVLIKNNPRVLHLVTIKPYLYGGIAARLARLLGWNGKTVVTVPGLGRLYDSRDNSWKARLRRTIVEWSLRFAVRDATVTFETGSDRDFWISRGMLKADDAALTRGAGIDLSRYVQRIQSRDGRQLRVLFAGRLLRSKGLDVFLEAASLNENARVEMLVAGPEEDGDADAISPDELHSHPKVVYLGFIQDMPALLADVDIVVLPSRYNEGIPRILLEAAACGCVPVATRFPGSMELIDDGKTGYFLRQEDPREQARELAAVLGAMCGDTGQLAKIGANAAQHVRLTGFAAEDVTAAFFNLYDVPAFVGSR